MIRFPIVDPALEGFRVTRAQPAAVALWAAVLFAANLGFLGIMIALGLGPVLATIKPFDAASLPPDLAARVGAAGVWLPGVAALFLGVNAVLYTAVLRAVMQPQEARYGYLRLGVQELRQVGLWLYAVAAMLGLQIVLLTVEAAAEAAAAGLEPGVGRLLTAGVAVTAFLATFYPLLRLSIAPAMTFEEGRVRLFSAWALTRGQFWRLFGSYGVAALLALAVLLLCAVVIAPVISDVALATGAGPEMLQKASQPDLSSLRAFLSVETVMALVTNAVVTALALAILVAPAPVIYLALRTSATKP